MNEEIIFEKETAELSTKKAFLKKHRKVVICTVAVGFGIVGYLIFKNRQVVKESFNMIGKPAIDGMSKNVKPPLRPLITASNTIVESVPETIADDITSGKVIKLVEVNSHIRNLPRGYRPSPEKIAQAKELGIELLEQQTFVNPYIKKVA